MKCFKSFIFLLLFSFSGLVAQNVMEYDIKLTTSEQAFLKKHPTIRVHNEMDWPPFNFNENGIPKGLSIDYMNLIAKRAGINIEYISGPAWGEFLEMMKKKELDVMLNIVKTREREKYILYTDTYITNPNVIVSKKEVAYNTIESLLGKRVAIPKGWFTEEILKTSYPGIIRVTTANQLDALKAVIFGQADAALGELAPVKYLIDQNILSGLHLSGEVKVGNPDIVNLNIGIRNDWPELQSILKKAMATVTSREMREIRQRWVTPKEMTSKANLSSEEEAYIRQHPNVRVASLRDHVPFTFEEAGEQTGFVKDMLDLLSSKTGLNFIYEMGIWSENLQKFKKRKVDLITDISYKKERESFTLFTKPYYEVPTVIFVRDDFGEYTGIQSLKGKRVGIIVDTFLEKELREIGGFELVEFEGNDAMTKALAYGQIDVLINNFSTTNYRIRKNNLNNIKIVGEFDIAGIGKEDLRLGVRPDKPMLYAILQKGMASIKEGEWNLLTNRWVGAKLDQSAPTETIPLDNEEKAYLKAHPVIKVSNETNWPPFDFAINGEPRGYMIDMINVLAKRIGIKVEYVTSNSWSGLQEKFYKGELDMLQSINKTPEREKRGLFSEPLYQYRNYFIVRSDAEDIWNIDQLKGKRVAVPKGWSYEEFLKQKHPDVNVVTYGDTMSAFQAVIDGHADAIIESRPVAKYLFRKHFISDLKISGWFKEFDAQTSRKLHLMAHFNAPDLINMFNKALATFTPGELQELEEKWIGEESKSDQQILLSDQEKDYLAKKGPINMCVDPDWMPYEMIDKNGMHVGMAADILKLLQERSGVTLKLVPTKNWTESIEYAKSRKCDILSLAMETPKRKKYMDFTTPYLSFPFVIATRSEEVFVEKLESVLDKPLAMVKGYAYVEILKNRYPDINLVEVGNIMEGLKMVRDHKVYGFIDSLASIAYTIQHEGMTDVKIAGKFEDSWELGIGTRNDEPILNSILQKGLDTISDAEKQQAYSQWFSIMLRQGFDYSLIWKILAGAAMIILGTIYWNRRLARLNLELKETEQALKEEVSRRAEYEESLKAAKTEAENANRAKSEFLANMSHEIRTPLNAVIGFSELLEKTDVTPKQKGYLTSIKTGGRTLLSIINDILDLSKIEAGKLKIQPEPVMLAGLLEDIRVVFEPKAKEKGIELRLEIAGDVPECLILDETRMRQVLFNLVGNAIKFTHMGWVEIKAETHPCEQHPNEMKLQIAVRDTGIGIPKDQQTKIFDSFVQQEGQSSRKYGGTGLGLAISQKLVQMMGGAIELKSNPGSGSVFTVILHHVGIGNIKAGSKTEDASSVPSVRFNQATLLLVDDVESNRKLIVNYLDDVGLKIVEATNGSQAWMMCGAMKPDIVLMDIRMPIMDGIEATTKIKADATLASIPVIALTASMRAEDRSENVKLFDGYLTKPISFHDLINELRRFLPHETTNDEDDSLIHDPNLDRDLPEKERDKILKSFQKEVQPLWDKASKGWSFEDTLAFSDSLMKFGQKFDLETIVQFATDLKAAIEGFNIRKMEQDLKHFSEILEHWQKGDT